jgi:hypothetical protein
MQVFIEIHRVIQTDTAATPGTLPNLDLFLCKPKLSLWRGTVIILDSLTGACHLQLSVRALDNATATLMYLDINDFVSRK